MKITYEIEELYLKHTWKIARNSSDSKKNIMVKIEKNGIVGIGEAAPNIRYNETIDSTVGLIEEAIPLFENMNLWNFVDLGFALKSLDPAQTAAKAGLDIGLMDWVAKSSVRDTTVLVVRLLGERSCPQRRTSKLVKSSSSE